MIRNSELRTKKQLQKVFMTSSNLNREQLAFTIKFFNENNTDINILRENLYKLKDNGKECTEKQCNAMKFISNKLSKETFKELIDLLDEVSLAMKV